MAISHIFQHIALIYVVIMGVLLGTQAQETVEMTCVPTIGHKFDVCPAGYCCVRDEFLATYVYCKKIGTLNDNCTTRETESACPCGLGLYCRANILGAFPSLYGKCEVNPNVTSSVDSVVG